MSFLATCRASIYRATTVTALGDTLDDNSTPVVGLEDVPASLIEKSRKVYDQASGELRTIRYCVGRLVPGTDIRKGDRIKDNTTGTMYALDELTIKPRSISGSSDLVLDLRIL